MLLVGLVGTAISLVVYGISRLPNAQGGMSQNQIQTVERQTSDAMVQALNSATSRVSCQPGFACQLITTIDRKYTCQAGGTIHTTGSWTGGANVSVANFRLNARQTITDWRCVSGWTVNGDPYINYSGQVTGTGTNVNFDLNQSLGWKAIGQQGGRQSCQTSGGLNYNISGGNINIRLTCSPGGTVPFVASF